MFFRILFFLSIFLVLLVVSGCETPDSGYVSCEDLNIDECSGGCVVCPPCVACSSISCHSKEFCDNIGFEPEWYNSTRPKQVE